MTTLPAVFEAAVPGLAAGNGAGGSGGSASSMPVVSPARSIRLASVADATGAGDVSTLRVEKSESAIGVSVRVPGAEEPWLCLASRTGEVQEVRDTGSEGAL